MRIAKNGMRFIKRGELPFPEKQEEPKKETAKPLTEAQKRKVEKLKKRIADENRARLNPVPKGAEVRG